MHKKWDDSMKRLIRENPQHFVSWVLPGAQFKRAMSIELKNRTRETDYLPEVTLNGKEILIDFEIQSSDDVDMMHRLLEYNVLATLEHNRRVLTCVIYLRRDSNIAESPLIWTLPNGQQTLRFSFIVIKLWEIPAEDIIKTGLLGLLPLVPLAKDGKRHDLVEQTITELAVHEKYELLSQAKTIAGLVFKDEAEQGWLERIFAVYKDIIEDSWVYQETIQKGKLEALHQAILDVIQERFSEIAPYAKRQIEGIGDTEVLRRLNVVMSTVKTAEEALQYLIASGKDDKKN
jgi:hypothetical protein